jgi:hypothetical protein
MSIKLVVLKTGENLISEVKELISEEKVCGYLFENPFKVKVINPVVLSSTESVDVTQEEISISVSRWIELTNETKIPVSFDTVIAIVEPLESLKNFYMEKINGENESIGKVSFTEEQ